MEFELPHTRASLARVGVTAVDERAAAARRERDAWLCAAAALLVSPLAAFTKGVVAGAVGVLLVAARAWLGLAGEGDGYRRVWLAASWGAPTLTYSLAEVGREGLGDSGDFVDLWNMWPVEQGEAPAAVSTRQTHTVVVELVGSTLRLLYPTSNLPRLYSPPPAEVVVFAHHHAIDVTRAAITLANPEGRPSSLYSKRLPLTITFGELTLALFPLVSCRKALLHRVLLQRRGEAAAASTAAEESVEVAGGEEGDLGLVMINLVVTRFGAQFLTREVLLTPIERAFKQQVRRKVRRFLRNVSLRGFEPGRAPRVRGVGRPWRDARGLWVELEVSCMEGASIIVEANHLRLADQPASEAEEGEDEETEEGAEEVDTWALVWQVVDRQVQELAFTLRVERVEAVLLLNLPPDHAVQDRGW